MIKVAICTPSGDLVHADYAMSLAALTYRCLQFEYEGERQPAIGIALINVKGSLVVNNRNQIVELAKEKSVDYLLFLDSDITVHPHTLRALLRNDKDIVGGTYVGRSEPHRLLGHDINGKLLDQSLSETVVDFTELMEVGTLPTGCLLIKMSVFDKLEKPYFQTPAHKESSGEVWIEGEDVFFCRSALAAGFKIWLDWNVTAGIGHIGQLTNKITVQQVEKEEVGRVVH